MREQKFVYLYHLRPARVSRQAQGVSRDTTSHPRLLCTEHVRKKRLHAHVQATRYSTCLTKQSTVKSSIQYQQRFGDAWIRGYVLAEPRSPDLPLLRSSQAFTRYDSAGVTPVPHDFRVHSLPYNWDVPVHELSAVCGRPEQNGRTAKEISLRECRRR